METNVVVKVRIPLYFGQTRITDVYEIATRHSGRRKQPVSHLKVRKSEYKFRKATANTR